MGIELHSQLPSLAFCDSVPTPNRINWSQVESKHLSDNATSMIGLCQEGKSSPDALRRSAGVILLDSSPRVSGFSAAVPIPDRTRLPFADAAFYGCSED